MLEIKRILWKEVAKLVMRRIILKNVLVFLILFAVLGEYNYDNFRGKLKKKKNGSEPLTHAGYFRIMESKDLFKQIMKDDEVWSERISKLDLYGNVNKINGRFIFKKCESSE